jgi:hypothetical protein
MEFKPYLVIDSSGNIKEFETLVQAAECVTQVDDSEIYIRIDLSTPDSIIEVLTRKIKGYFR